MKDTEFKPGEFARFPNSEIPAMLDLLRENGHIISDRKIDEDEDNAVYFSGHSWEPAWFDGHYASMHKDTELTRSEFMFKATRGKVDRKEAMRSAHKNITESMEHANSTRGKGISTSAKNAQVEFDPSKEIEVLTVDDEWQRRPNAFYVGKDKSGNHVLQLDGGGYYAYSFIRNIEPEFDSSMLKPGESIQITDTDKPDWIGLVLTRTDEFSFYCMNGNEDQKAVLFDKTHSIIGKRVKVNITTEEV